MTASAIRKKSAARSSEARSPSMKVASITQCDMKEMTCNWFLSKYVANLSSKLTKRSNRDYEVDFYLFLSHGGADLAQISKLELLTL